MPKEFISAYELSRLLNLPYARITALLHSGKLKPDAISSGGKVALFSADRVSQVEAAIFHWCAPKNAIDALLGGHSKNLAAPRACGRVAAALAKGVHTVRGAAHHSRATGPLRVVS